MKRLLLPSLLACTLSPAASAQQGAWDLLGETSGSGTATNYGAEVRFVGDTDGDGVPDYLVVEPGLTLGLSTTFGAVHLYSGADSQLIRTHTDPVRPCIGAAIAPAGDLDGDGFADYLYTHSSWTDFMGWTSAIVVAISGSTGTTLWEQDSGMLGYTLRGLDGGSDMSGDGVPDVIVADSLRHPNGAVDVLSGVDGSLLSSISGAGGQVLGGMARFIPDRDGDGIDEILTSGVSGFFTFGGWFVYSGGLTNHSLLVSGLSQAHNPFVVPTADHDGDGVTDFAFVDQDAYLSVYLTIASGFDGYQVAGYSAPIGYEMYSAPLASSDFNGDGIEDLALSQLDLGTYDEQIVILSGQGFAELRRFLSAAGTSHLEAGADLNGDGAPELLSGGTAHLLDYRKLSGLGLQPLPAAECHRTFRRLGRHPGVGDPLPGGCRRPKLSAPGFRQRHHAPQLWRDHRELDPRQLVDVHIPG